MSILIGNYKHSLDEKGRITIPSKFRVLLGDKVFITLSVENTIVLRTETGFKKWQEVNIEGKNSLDSNIRDLKIRTYAYSYPIEFDKQGRILIPQELISKIKIKKNVQIVGMGDEVEIFTSEAWDQFESKTSKGLLKKDGK